MSTLDHETTTPSPSTPFVVCTALIIDPQQCPTCHRWQHRDEIVNVWDDGAARCPECRP